MLSTILSKFKWHDASFVSGPPGGAVEAGARVKGYATAFVVHLGLLLFLVSANAIRHGLALCHATVLRMITCGEMRCHRI